MTAALNVSGCRGFLVGWIVALFVLFLWSANLFADLRLRLTNVYFVSEPVSEKIVIVAIDDASLEEYGRLTQWPRSIYADFIRILNAAQARVIAFDILFTDRSDEDAEFARAIQEARTDDTRTRVVMSLVGVQRSETMSDATQRIQFRSVQKPAEELLGIIEYSGYVNAFPDIDSSIRRQPSQIQHNGQIGLSFSIITYLAYLRIPTAAFSQLIISGDGTLQITPERQLPVDDLGFWMQNYFGPPYTPTQPTYPVVSFRDVLAGNIDPTLFDDKIVLVGVMNASALTDWYPVPASISGNMMAGVEIHANAVETLIQDRALHEQGSISQIITIVIVSIVASMVYAQLRWYWMLVAGLFMFVTWLISAFTLFNTQREIINLFHSSLAIVLPIIPNIGLSITLERRQRQKAEFLLDSVVEASSQGLALPKVVSSIGADAQKLLAAPGGGIWLDESGNGQYILAQQWSTLTPELEALVACVQQEKDLVVDGQHVGIPLIWQQRMVGILAMQVSKNDRIRRTSLDLLREFAERVVPGLENAILHTQIQRQKNLVEAVIMGSPTGVLVLDELLHIVHTNATLHKILSQTNNMILEQSFINLLRAETVPDQVLNDLEQRFSRGKLFRQDMEIAGCAYSLDAAPLHDSKQWVIILNDVTALTELNRLKTRLIRLATHDLKNPLSRITGYGNVILRTKDIPTEQRQTFVQEMVDAAQYMKRIITDILNSEQVRSSEMEQEPTDFRAIVDQVVERYWSISNNKGLSLSAQLADNLPMIMGNAQFLHQVVANLLSNAVKYTGESGQIWVRLVQADANNLRLEVEDTGFGISAEGQLKLFSEFYRIRTTETAHITGTGLGLSLAYWIVEAHNGHIWVESEEGVGSTFYVELPVLTEVIDAVNQ